MRELFVCEGCGHQADGVKDLVVLESFAFAGPEPATEVDLLLVECECGDLAELPIPA